MQHFTLIPQETIFLISILFLITVGVIRLRFVLYRKIKKLNKQIERLLLIDSEENDITKKDSKNTDIQYGGAENIIENLKKRYEKVSGKLEYVNTLALIDGAYRKERIPFLGLNIQCDRADSITRILPNLLIAFGLIGTFWGITSNLTNISNIVTGFSQSNPDVGKLVQGLQSPLRDMGVAFSTSLCGLVCGSLLTLANTYWNTSISKYQLISSLEDYLDNSCNKGNTRLDLAIKTMVSQQNTFLTNFHDEVTKAIESSFGNAAKQIVKECSETNKHAVKVYTKFSDAAGTISTGASTFEYAANSLEIQTKILADSLHEFKSGVETFKIAANQIEQNNIIQSLDRVLSELNNNQQSFSASTITLENALIGITTSNRKATQIAKQVYETWQDSTSKIVAASETIDVGARIFQQTANSLEGQTQTFAELMPQLKTGIDTFASAANKVKTNNIIKHLDTAITNLSTTQQAFANSAQALTIGVEEIITNNQQTTELANRVYDGLEMSTEGIQKGANNLLDAAQIIQDSQLAIELTKAAQGWKAAQIEFTNSTAIFSQAAQNIQPIAANLEPAIVSIDRAANSLQQVGLEVVNLSKNTLQVSESTQTAIAGFDSNYLKVLNNTDLSVQSLGTISSSNWQSLFNTLEIKIQSDRDSSQRLLMAIEKLEIIISNISNGSNGNRVSGLQGFSQSN
jgi:exonuclease VII small subunit